MNQMIYTVRDMAAQCYLEPFFALNDDVAKRAFQDACRREGHQFNLNPTDYALYCIGHFNALEGTLDRIEPHKLMDAASVFGIRDVETVEAEVKHS